MTVKRMDHVGVVVDDLAAATEFFLELGLERQGGGSVDGRWVDRIVGLDGVQTEFAMMQTPDGHGRLELIKFHSPPLERGDGPAPANTSGIRHLAFVVEDIDAVLARLRARGSELVGEVEQYENVFRLCYSTSAARRGSSSSWPSGSAETPRHADPLSRPARALLRPMRSAPRCGHTENDHPERTDEPVKLTTQTQVTVDGVMQGNGGASEEDRRSGFDGGGGGARWCWPTSAPTRSCSAGGPTSSSPATGA